MKQTPHALLLWLAFTGLAIAQTTAVLAPVGKQQFFDSSGRPLNGGKLYSFAAGTSSPLSTFADSSGTGANPNPLILDAAGRGSLWILPNTPYKFTLRDRNNVLVWTVDNITIGTTTGGGGGGGGSFLPLTGGIMSGSIAFAGNQIYSIGDSTHRLSSLYTASVNVYSGLFPGVSGAASVGSNSQRFNKLWANGADIDGEFALPQISGGTAQCLEASTAGIVSGTGAPCGSGGGGSAAGPTDSIQFKTGGGSFGGDAALTWDNGSKQLTLTTAGATAGLVVNTGFIHADAGFVTSSSATNSIQSPIGGLSGKWLIATDSLFLIEEAAPALSASGQVRIYADSSTHNVQVSQNGAAFTTLGGGSGSPGGSSTNVQFNSSGAFGGSANFAWDNSTRQLHITTAGATAGINVTTGFVQADGGLSAAACSAANCIQAISGGLSGKWLTATDSVFFLEEGAPALSAGGQVRIYADSGTHTLQISQDGGAYTAIGSGSGTPGGATTNVQFNSAGSFAGSANLAWDNSTRQLNVTTAGATAGIKVTTGYFEAIGGFTASTCVATNCIQAVTGGVTGKWVTATDSVFMVEEAAPALSAGGQVRIYADSTTHNVQVSQNGGAFAPLGGSGTPGGATTNVQFNSSGSFAGSANMVWDNSTRQLNITTAGATAGIKVTTGYFEAIGGFTASTCVAINCMQAPTGGVSGKFLTATDSVFLLEEATPALSGAGQVRIYGDSGTHTVRISQNGGAYAALGGAFVPLAGGSMSGLLNIAVGGTGAANFTNSSVGTPTLVVGNVSGTSATFGSDIVVNLNTAAPVQLGASAGAVWLPTVDRSVSLGDNTHRFNNIFGDVFLTSTLSMAGVTTLDASRNAALGNVTGGTFTGSVGFASTNSAFNTVNIPNGGILATNGTYGTTGDFVTIRGTSPELDGSLLGRAFEITASSTVNGNLVVNTGHVSSGGSLYVNGWNAPATTQTYALVLDDQAGNLGSGITIKHGGTFDAAWSGGAIAAFDVVKSDAFTHMFLIMQTGKIFMNRTSDNGSGALLQVEGGLYSTSIMGGSSGTGKITLAAGNVSGLSSVEVQGRSTGVTTHSLIVNDVANPFGSGITMKHGATYDAAWQAGASTAFHVVGNDGTTTRFLVLQTGVTLVNRTSDNGTGAIFQAQGSVSSTGYISNGQGGLTGSILVRNSAGSGTCSITFNGGLVTASTC